MWRYKVACIKRRCLALPTLPSDVNTIGEHIWGHTVCNATGSFFFLCYLTIHYLPIILLAISVLAISITCLFYPPLHMFSITWQSSTPSRLLQSCNWSVLRWNVLHCSNVWRIMHCVSVAILSRPSQFPLPQLAQIDLPTLTCRSTPNKQKTRDDFESTKHVNDLPAKGKRMDNWPNPSEVCDIDSRH